MSEEPVFPLLGLAEVQTATWEQVEACGVFWEPPGAAFPTFMRLPNASDRPEHNYTIKGSDLVLVREWSEVNFVGIWHTHPPRARRSSADDDDSSGPRPSPLDLDYHPLRYRMIIGFEGVLREFNPVNGEEILRWEN